MLLKEYYSTGESAQLLNISRSTVSRKFDLGVLTGKKNPITGERFVNRESLESFLKLYNVSAGVLGVGKKKAFLLTSDLGLLSFLRQIFLEDEQIRIERVQPGNHLLGRCLKEAPHLLLVDEESLGQAGIETVLSIRRLDELNSVKILCLTDPKDVERGGSWGADAIWVKDMTHTEQFKKRLMEFLGLQADVDEGERAFKHHRRWPRVPVRLPAKIWFYRIRSPYLRDPGEATVENISCGGALLSKIQLEKGGIPTEPFRIFVKIDQAPLRDWRAHCKVVRLQSNGGPLTAGVEFVRLSKSNFKMIRTLTQL
jgi:hypothetical protein